MDLSNAQSGTNPVEKNRRTTDGSFIFVFLLIFMVWLAIGIAGFFFHQSTEDNDNFVQIKHLISEMKSVVNAPVTKKSARFITEILMLVIMIVAVTVLYTLLIEKFPKIFMWIGMIMHVLLTLIVALEISLFRGISIEGFMEIATVACYFSIRIIFTIAGAVSMNKSINESRSIIQNACLSIRRSPALILFTTFLAILVYFMILFIINSLQAILMSDCSTSLIVFFLMIFISGSIFMLIFILHFALMVISEYTVNYYWKNDKKPSIEKSMIQTLRYHIGTIALSSTVVIPYSCAIFQFLKHKRGQGNDENVILYVIAKIFLTLTMPINTLIFSSIYGTSFSKSSQKTFDTMLHRCSLFLASTWVLEGLFDITAWTANDLKAYQEFNSYSAPILVLGSVFPTLFLSYLAHICTRAMLVNYVIISNKEN